MRKYNVINFPVPAIERLVSLAPAERLPEQLDLFAGSYAKVSAITFINLENIDQNTLLSSLIKHSIRTIIDLRSRPVFPKPHFDHKYIMSYFYHRSMNYIECAMSRSPSFELRPQDHPRYCDRLDQWISADMSLGITACIVDSAAIHSGAVAAFRHCIANRTKSLIEVHPRSLI